MSDYPPDPPDWKVLIELAHRDGRAAICRDPDESLWLAWNLDDFSDTEDWDDEPPGDDEEWDPRWEFGSELEGYEIAGLGTAVNKIVALGGRMPPGAERVEVVDEWGGRIPATAGSGVWLAVKDAPAGDEQAVRFFTAGGEPVDRPLPPQVEVAELGEVGEPCPLCGSSRWQLLRVPTADGAASWSTADGEWSPGRRAARCAECRYLYSLPSEGPTQHIVLPPPESDPEDLERQHREHLRDAWQRAVEGLGTAPIGLARDWPGVRDIASWGGAGPESISDITLDHGASSRAEGPWISVTTSAEALADDDLLRPDRWLEDNLVAALSDRWRDGELRSEDGAELRQELRRRRVEAHVRALPRQRIDIPVDRGSVEFLVIGDDTAWSGYGICDGVAVTVTARGFTVSDLELESARVEQY